MAQEKHKEPIAALRKRANLTIKEASALFDVDRTTVIRWENGEPRIPLKRLPDAERIFGVSRTAIRPDIFAVSQ